MNLVRVLQSVPVWGFLLLLLLRWLLESLCDCCDHSIEPVEIKKDEEGIAGEIKYCHSHRNVVVVIQIIHQGTSMTGSYGIHRIRIDFVHRIPQV